MSSMHSLLTVSVSESKTALILDSLILGQYCVATSLLTQHALHFIKSIGANVLSHFGISPFSPLYAVILVYLCLAL